MLVISAKVQSGRDWREGGVVIFRSAFEGHRGKLKFVLISLTAFGIGLALAQQLGFLQILNSSSQFLVTTPLTQLHGFAQTSSVHTRSTYRVNYRSRTHRLSSVALIESRNALGMKQNRCHVLSSVKASETTVPFELTAGHGVVFNHHTLLANGAQTGWMQLLFDHRGSCVEISAKGLAANELDPQDLILMVSTLEQE